MWAEGGGWNEWQSYLSLWLHLLKSDPLERIALFDSHASQHFGLYVRLLYAVSQANIRLVLLLNSDAANDPGWKTESAALD